MNQGSGGGRSGRNSKSHQPRVFENDLQQLVRELGLVRERGIIRVDSLQLRRLELLALRRLVSQWDEHEPFTTSLLNLVSLGIQSIPEGLAKRAAVRLFGFDDEPTFARPSKWRTDARNMYPRLGVDDWRKGLEQEILGIIAANILALAGRRLQETRASDLTSQRGPRSDIHVRVHDRSRPVFVQFLNPEILACYGYVGSLRQLPITIEEALHATRLAVLATDTHLVMPASYLFEMPAITSYLEAVSDLLVAGLIAYCAPTNDLAAYGDQKREEYRHDRDNPYDDMISPAVLSDLGWTPRQRLATALDITSRWRGSFDEGGELRGLVISVARHWAKGANSLDRMLMAVPDKLDGQAFVSRFVMRAMPTRLTSSESLHLSLLFRAPTSKVIS